MLDYLIEKISTAKVQKEPFPFFSIENVFPEDFYQELLQHFPEDEHFQALSEKGVVRPGTYGQRLCFSLDDKSLLSLSFFQMMFWIRLVQQLKSEAFISALIRTLGVSLVGMNPDLTLVSDRSDYSIGPHTDYPQKVLTLLFYFPQDGKQKELGTSVYEPIDPTFRCEGFKHHPFDGFKRVYSAPFVPNSLFGFVKSDNSFHGVEPIGAQDRPRNSLSYQFLKYD